MTIEADLGKHQQIGTKIDKFELLNSQIADLLAEGRSIPDDLYQTHLVTDRWLAVNVPEWKSKYGFPSEQGGKKA